MWAPGCSNEHKISLPNFLIIGTQKSGTSSCHYYLKQHPDVFMSSIKEPHFMADQFLEYPKTGLGSVRIYRHKIKDFNEYCSLYEGSSGKKAIGESCADSLYYHEKAIPCIKQFFGDPRIIILLRNPIDRAFSAYTERVRDDQEHLSFDDALAAEQSRIYDGWYNAWFYRDVGFYHKPVKAYLETFSRVEILLFDDLKKDAATFVSDIFEFLDVDASFVPDLGTLYNTSGIPKYKKLNDFFIKDSKLQRITRTIGKHILGEDRWVNLRDSLRSKILVKTEMNPATKKQLRDEYRNDIQELESLIGYDLSNWYTR